MSGIPNAGSIQPIARPRPRARFVQAMSSIHRLTAGSNLQSDAIPSQPSIMPLNAGLGSLQAKDAIWQTTHVG